ncbi:MAG: glycosyltransferase family 4 protein [Spirosomataceae bacterium]
MKIVILTCWYTDNMGYAENCLPRSLAKLGHEVHIISSLGKAYFNDSSYEKTYASFAGPAIAPAGTTQLTERLFLHRLPHGFLMGRIYLKGLYSVLKSINPEVVQSFEIASPYTLQAVLLKPFLGFKYFNGSHTTLSVFPLHHTWSSWSLQKLKWVLFKQFPGWVVSWFTNRCYPASSDCALIATTYMGMPADKCTVCPLGVETDVFMPANTSSLIQDCEQKRAELGYIADDIVCIYTGRFSEDKNPLVLAKAIASLQKTGETTFKGLFIGEGIQRDAILACEGCQVISFLPHTQLPLFYRLADIGVWPTQESTSMLDAAASGIPIIVNDTLKATERIDGNGLSYKLGNFEDLAHKLRLLGDKSYRKKLGDTGRYRMETLFSWDKIAKERIQDYLTF